MPDAFQTLSLKKALNNAFYFLDLGFKNYSKTIQNRNLTLSNVFGNVWNEIWKNMSFVWEFSKVWVSPQKFPKAPNVSAHQAAEYSTETPLTRQDAEELRLLSKFDSWEPTPLKTPWQDGVFFSDYIQHGLFSLFYASSW